VGDDLQRRARENRRVEKEKEGSGKRVREV
jgi:hypothetical protein